MHVYLCTCMYGCVCMFVFIYLCSYVCIYLFISLFMYVRMCVRMYVYECTYVCNYVCIYVCMDILCTCMYVCMCVYVCLSMYLYMYECMYVRIYLLICVRTYVQVEQKSIGLKFSKSRTRSHVTYSCRHNSSRFTFPKFAHSWCFSVFHSLQSITPRVCVVYSGVQCDASDALLKTSHNLRLFFM